MTSRLDFIILYQTIILSIFHSFPQGDCCLQDTMTIPLTSGMSWKVPEWQFSLAMKTGSALSECPQMVPRSAQDHGITLCGWVFASGHIGKVAFFFFFALYWHQGLPLDYSKGTGSGYRCFTSFCRVCPLRGTGEFRNIGHRFLVVCTLSILNKK